MYPQLQDLIALEIDTLQTISEIGEFQTFDGLYRQGAARRNFRKEAESLDLHADFVLDVRLRGDRRTANCQRWIHIGAFIEGERATNQVKRASYSLVLFRRNSVDSPVVRKLHFDYEALSTRNRNEPKPSSHLQMCGKASPHLIGLGFNQQRLSHHYPGFEQPRVPAMPISFALLIDWLFTEFQSDRHSRAIHQNRQWRNQVIAAETVVLKPYFLEAANHIGSAAHATAPLIRSMLYGL
jgi:hypothetical protein